MGLFLDLFLYSSLFAALLIIQRENDFIRHLFSDGFLSIQIADLIFTKKKCYRMLEAFGLSKLLVESLL